MATAEWQTHSVRWLTVEVIRTQQRMRRDAVVAVMLAGELLYERRGRIRYARVSDVVAWEEARLSREQKPVTLLIQLDLADFCR